MIFEATKWLQCCRTSYSHRRLPTSRFTLFGFYARSLSLLNSHSAHLLHPSSPASQLTLPLASLCLFPPYRVRVPKTPVARVMQAFSTKTIHLKRRPTTHWCTRRCCGSRHSVYGSADTLGLLAPILHEYAYFCIKNYILAEYLI